MKLKHFLEKKGEKAHRDAIAMGLQYKGFGYWADPNTGEAKYKTVNDQLVPVEGDVESDMYKGGDKAQMPSASGVPQQPGVPGQMQQPGMQMAIGTGQNINPSDAPAARPHQKKGWNAGPDGDTCVGGQPREEIPDDTFVGKTNNLKWTAGKDGSNAIELGGLREQIAEAQFNPNRKQHFKNVVRAMRDGPRDGDGTETIIDAGLALGTNKIHSIMRRAGATDPRLDDPKFADNADRIRNLPFDPRGTGEKARDNRPTDRNERALRRRAQRARGDEMSGETQPTGQARVMLDPGFGMRGDLDTRDRKNAVNYAARKMADVVGARRDKVAPKPTTGKSESEPSIRSTTVPKTSSGSWDMDFDDDAPRRPDWIDDAGVEAKRSDMNIVDGMNAAVREYMQDPEYDLDQFDDRRPVASGAFGRFTIGDDGIGIKEGNIGPGELAALYAMRDNPAFPTLINGRFEAPFLQQAAAYNNPNNETRLRADSNGDYFNPDEASDFEKRFPGAWGKYAMTIADGDDLYSVLNSLGPEERELAMRSFWEARADLHRAGFSHNDMHGGNIMIDPETGQASILDLGLANDDPVSALMEALGGLNYEQGNDRQLARQVAGAYIPSRIRDRMDQRMGAFEERMMDDMDVDPSDQEAFDMGMSRLAAMLPGNIRMTKDELDEIRTRFPRLADGDYVKERIAELYDGLWDDDEVEEPAPQAPAPTIQSRNPESIGSNVRKIANILFDMDD